MSLILSRRSALRLGGAALLSAWLPMVSPPQWLPLRPGPDGAELTIPPDMLSALAPGGCDQWAMCRHFQIPALVLFPAIDMEGIHRLVDRLFTPRPRKPMIRWSRCCWPRPARWRLRVWWSSPPT